MATVSMTGLGSGMDIESLVSGLVSASSGQKTAASAKVTSTQAAVTAMSGVGSLLSELKTAVDSLDTATELAGFKGTSGNSNALAITTSGAARPGNYSVKVWALAQEQRTYSGTQTSGTNDLLQTGTVRLTQGGSDFDVAVESTDSLTDIAAKINGAGAKVSASVFYDGTAYRLQLRSTETGTDAGFTIQEMNGVSLGLTAVGATKQAAQNADVEIDGFRVSSKTNTVTGAIEGVTLDLKDETDDYFNVGIQADTSSMKTALQTFVDKYNAVIGRIHSVAGYGDSKATSEVLKGDPTLRAITAGLSSQVLSQASTGGSMTMLADLGIKLNNDGTLKIDDTKLTTALTKNPDNFAKVLAGDGTSKGIMDQMSELLKSYTTFGSGLISNSKDALNARIKVYQETVAREQTRLDAMEQRLRKTLNAMDTQVGAYKNQLTYLSGLG